VQLLQDAEPFYLILKKLMDGVVKKKRQVNREREKDKNEVKTLIEVFFTILGSELSNRTCGAIIGFKYISCKGRWKQCVCEEEILYVCEKKEMGIHRKYKSPMLSPHTCERDCSSCAVFAHLHSFIIHCARMANYFQKGLFFKK
jgi:hypothetical protein